jgi:hypothetical protein
MSSVRFIKNIGLDDTATGIQTSTVDEPTAAAIRDELFITGNWFASHSSDGGTTWTLIDPFTALPAAAGGFCCDQVTLHESSRNLWIWILQYVEEAGSNVFRLAVSQSGARGPWTYWDFSPDQLDPEWATDVMFDFPDAATTDNNLYLTYNVFQTSSGDWLQAVVFKMPLDDLVSGNLEYEFYSIATNGSLRLTRGATSDMYFASHNGQNPVRIFHWPDAANATMTSFDVSAGPWSGQEPYSATGPGGAEWLGRLDSRITGGWVVGNQVGFLWTANTQSGRPQPYAKAIVVDTTTRSLVSEPDIWNEQLAWAYPSAQPNTDGVVGVSLFFGGGGQSHPTHVVGFRDGSQWTVATSRASTHGPAGGRWGDYLSCRLHDPDTAEWVASGYTLQGGTDRRFIEPQYVHFGVDGAVVSPPPPFPGRLLKFPPLTKGPDVVAWQQRMIERGFAIAADGAYGKNSKAACIAFQQQQGIKADGIVGPDTWKRTFA